MLLGTPRRFQQRYRIDATIMLLGIPVFKRSGVGSGWASMEEIGAERKLQFAAGSWPEQSQGLNRLGFVEERSTPAGSTYFGFMTASGEESFADARRTLESAGESEAKYTAIAGEVRPGKAECKTVKFLFPAKYHWGRWDELFPLARQAFATEANRGEVLAETPREASHSFLHTLTNQMAAGPGVHSRAFVYGNREMVLQSKVQWDGALLRLDGKTLLGRKSLGHFRLWYHQGEAVPVRMDIPVKGFLRLTFEKSAG